ncbi:MAG: hypothetical protein H7Y11_09695, partial [Armatimonadetes bacterium]|nr:hypothetical protein [Anaerolineae bacterium]
MSLVLLIALIPLPPYPTSAEALSPSYKPLSVYGEGFGVGSSPVTTTAYRATPLYTGPGITYAESGVLLTSVVVTITERNTAGTWLYVESDTLAGWVLSGTLNLPPELHYSALPVTALADADPTTVNSRSLATLY